MIITDGIEICGTATTTINQSVVTVTVNGKTYQAIAQVTTCSDPTVILSVYDFRPDDFLDFKLPPRDVNLPEYIQPLWMKEKRRVPRQKKRVPAFKPGPHQSHRRGAY